MFELKHIKPLVVIVSLAMLILVHFNKDVVARTDQIEKVDLIKRDFEEVKAVFYRIQHQDGNPNLSRNEFHRIMWAKKIIKKKGRFLNLAGISQISNKLFEVQNVYRKQLARFSQQIGRDHLQN